jgi:transposase
MALERKVYDREFKLNAIRLYEESGKGQRELERELGIGPGGISHWRKEFAEEKENAFPGNGNIHENDKELAMLRKENAILKQERDILKKAVGIFSKNQQ